MENYNDYDEYDEQGVIKGCLVIMFIVTCAVIGFLLLISYSIFK